MTVALRRVLPFALFVVLPVAVVTTMFVVGVVTGPLALDFDTELYPQAKELLAGHNPWPRAIWPPLAAAVAAPFTILPPTAAGMAFGLAGLACTAGALWLVGMRDWRVYGVVGLWPPVLGDIRIGHLTPLLCLLAAVVWRYRDRPLGAGLSLGLACGVKFFLWPLGLWLVAGGRVRAASIGAGVAVGSVLLLAPFAPLDDYVRTLRKVSSRFDQDSYSLFGFLTQLDLPETTARAAAFAVGAALLAADVAPRELRARDRLRARALTDRVVRLLRARLRPARDRAAAPDGDLVPAACDLGAAELGHRHGPDLGRRPRAGRLRDRAFRRRPGRAERGRGTRTPPTRPVAQRSDDLARVRPATGGHGSDANRAVHVGKEKGLEVRACDRCPLDDRPARRQREVGRDGRAVLEHDGSVGPLLDRHGRQPVLVVRRWPDPVDVADARVEELGHHDPRVERVERGAAHPALVPEHGHARTVRDRVVDPCRTPDADRRCRVRRLLRVGKRRDRADDDHHRRREHPRTSRALPPERCPDEAAERL